MVVILVLPFCLPTYINVLDIINHETMETFSAISLDKGNSANIILHIPKHQFVIKTIDILL